MHKPNHHSARASGVVRLGDPVLDRYLEFVESRARHNTVLATASDLKAFFADRRQGAGGGHAGGRVSASSPSSESPRGRTGSSVWPTVSRACRPARSSGGCRRCRVCSATWCCVET